MIVRTVQCLEDIKPFSKFCLLGYVQEERLFSAYLGIVQLSKDHTQHTDFVIEFHFSDDAGPRYITEKVCIIFAALKNQRMVFSRLPTC
jgi:hypothetical protein